MGPMSNWEKARNQILNRKSSLHRTVENKIADANIISEPEVMSTGWRKARNKVLNHKSFMYQISENKLTERNGKKSRLKLNDSRKRRKQLQNPKKAGKTKKHSSKKKRKEKVNNG